jgi:hypothetical protein
MTAVGNSDEVLSGRHVKTALKKRSWLVIMGLAAWFIYTKGPPG